VDAPWPWSTDAHHATNRVMVCYAASSSCRRRSRESWRLICGTSVSVNGNHEVHLQGEIDNWAGGASERLRKFQPEV
jgi:hypothetical protein